MSDWKNLFKKKQPIVIGMLHLPALPGSPNFAGDLDDIRKKLIADTKALSDGGVDALMMENFGDVPFTAGRVGAETIAAMTALAAEVKRHSKLPLGINVLRNDGESALAIAVAVGAQFIRVNVLSGARVTDQGLIQGIAHDLLRLRARLDAKDIAIMADVDVKHSAALAPRDIIDEVEDTIKRGLADAVIVSGAGTGKTADPEKVAKVAKAAGSIPVFLGSGVTAKNAKNYAKSSRGLIVGTAFKQGDVNSPVSQKLVKEFMASLKN